MDQPEWTCKIEEGTAGVFNVFDIVSDWMLVWLVCRDGKGDMIACSSCICTELHFFPYVRMFNRIGSSDVVS